MPRLVIPRLRILLEGLSRITGEEPDSGATYLIVAGINGDGSKYGRVEPYPGHENRDIRSGGASSPAAEHVIYEERLAELQRVFLRLIFGESRGASNRDLVRFSEAIANHVSTAAAREKHGWLPPSGGDLLAPDRLLGEVFLTVENWGDELSPQLTFGMGAQPARDPVLGMRKSTFLNRFREKWKTIKKPFDFDLNFDVNLVPSKTYMLALSGGDAQYRAKLSVTLVTSLPPRLVG